MLDYWSFVTAGQILFGVGAIERLGERARHLSIKRALVVTDKALTRVGVVDAAARSLQTAGVDFQIDDRGESEPSLELADELVERARRFNPDGVIGIGGGSNMDLAKATALLLSHSGPLRQFIGEDKVPGLIMPVICVPTTAGTGSEVSAAMILNDRRNQLKVGILSDYLRPNLALVDPRLATSCPAKPTADSGMDALTHAIEAFTAIESKELALIKSGSAIYQGSQPLTDSLAERAIELIGHSIRSAVHDPQNLAARSDMALAALLAGMAFSNAGVALVHALEYPIGGVTHCSHGEGNGLLLPFVMRYNLAARRPRFARIAALLGCDLTGMSEATAAEMAIVEVEQLKADLGIPSRLRDIGARQEDLRAFAEKAMGIHRIVRINPRPPSVDDLAQILQAAF